MIDIKFDDWNVKLTKQNIAFLIALILTLYFVYGLAVSLFLLIILFKKQKSVEIFRKFYNLELSQVELFNLNRKTVVDFITFIFVIVPFTNFVLLLTGNPQGKRKVSETYWLPVCKVKVFAEVSNEESGPATVTFTKYGLGGTEEMEV